MRHWVIDTNVVVSGLLTPGGPSAQILAAIEDGRIKLVYDSRILGEYRDVLHRPRLRIKPVKARDFLEALQNQWLITPITVVSSGPDPDDIVFIEAALATVEKVIITGNLADFPDETLHGVRVMTPSQGIGELGIRNPD